MPAEQNIEFYEPLQYLSETARELVLKIVEDRLLNGKDAALPEDGGEWKQRCEEMEERAQKAEAMEVQLRAAKMKLKQELEATQSQLVDLTTQLQGALAQVSQLQAENAALEEERARLEEEKAQLEERMRVQEQLIERLERENARLEEERQRLEAELASFRERLEQMERELAAAREELERAREEVARLEARVQELERQVSALEARLRETQAEVERLRARCQELERQVVAAEARARKAEAEAAELREELARRNNTRTRAQQTTLLGEHIDELSVENRRLKNMIGDTVTKLEEQGLSNIVKEVGLEAMGKPKTCFQRLYDDALAREARLKRLREEHASKSRSEVELRYTTWDQELQVAVDAEGASRAAEARLREARAAREAPLPLPVDTDPPPPMWHASPRRGSRDSVGSVDATWRLLPQVRQSALGVGNQVAREASVAIQPGSELSKSSMSGENYYGVHTSVVLQPPSPRSYQRPGRETDRTPRSPQAPYLGSYNVLPPLRA